MNATKLGSLEVICGSMFSGKSEELIRRIRRAELAKQTVLSVKHSLDDRTGLDFMASHDGRRYRAIATSSPQEILAQAGTAFEVIGIDEVQFFPIEIIDTIMTLVHKGIRVIVAGLDLDFRGIPFGCIPPLLSLADTVSKLKAICMTCGKEAHYTQRLVNEKPASFHDPIILVGAQECYEARCRDCFIIDQRPTFSQLQQ
jgi:thymidine kinase